MLNVIPRRIQEMHLQRVSEKVENGIVLHVDISGFTGLTEGLLKRGKKGAEVLSSVLNRVFSRAMEEVYIRGGGVADLEGDALIAHFPEEEPQRAFFAALSIHDYFRRGRIRHAGEGEWPISAAISIASGQLEWRIAGAERAVFYLDGDAIRSAASGRGAGGTEPVLDDSYIRLLQDKAGIAPQELDRLKDATGSPGRGRILRSTALRFASPSVISSRLTGEFRTVTPVFLHLERTDPTLMELRLEKVIGNTLLYGGDIEGVFASSRDFLSVLALFGAPRAWENDTQRAFDFVLALKQELGESIRAGISRGRVFAGITGNSRRCRYTVYGDTVNTSARLAMEADFGSVLVTREAEGQDSGSYEFSAARSWRPRGKQGNESISCLKGRVHSAVPRFRGELVGRERELNDLLKGMEPLHRGEFCGIKVVCGEPGIGKSRLIHAVTEECGSRCRTVRITCDDILRRSLNPFASFLRQLFHQDESRGAGRNRHIFEERCRAIQSELQGAGIESAVSMAVNLQNGASILGALLGHHWEGSVYSKLAPKARLENTVLALKDLITALASVRPLVLVLEDIQWIDSDSLQALETLTAGVEDVPFCILASCRPGDDGSIIQLPLFEEHYTVMHLDGIDGEASMLLVREQLQGVPGPGLLNFILRNSGGNPFYIKQFCGYLMEQGLLKKKEGIYELTETGFEIPSGIRSILVARIDRLPERLRHFMQTASVLGQEFSWDTLQLISENGRDLLLEGERLSLWTRRSDTVFSFNHALYRDTAYGMLLGKSLRRLHSRVADALIELNRNEPDLKAGEIALHLMESGQRSRAVDWGWRALCRALEAYRNEEALNWSERLMKWMSSTGPGSRNQLLLDVLLKRDRVLNTLGKRELQRKNLEAMLQLMEEENWNRRLAHVLKARGTYAWSLGDVDKAFRFFRQGLEYCKRDSDLSIRGKLLGNIANIHSFRGRFQEAREYYRAALSIHRRLDDWKQEGITLGNLAILLRRMGSDDEAREHYLRALDLHRKAGNRIGEGRILCGLGHLEEEPSDAREYYMKALAINREIGDIRNEAIILSSLGKLEALEEDFAVAQGHLDHALEIQRRLGNTSGEADTLSLFGEMYYHNGQWKNARRYFQKAIDLCRQTGNATQEFIYYGLMGLAALRDGDLDFARRCCLHCGGLIEKFDFPPSIDDGFSMLRRELLNAGIDGNSIPNPWREAD